MIQSHDEILSRLRKLCLSLPEAAEVEAWGHPTFRAGKKIFASFGFHEDRPCTSVKADSFMQQMLLDDERFFYPPYVGQHGWVGIWLDKNVDWSFVEELIIKSYRLVALKRMVKALDASL